MEEPKDECEKVPFFRSWRTWYVIVMATLVIQIIAYYLITLRFS
jgi:hypothetical protein